jgi:hypothetical protein
MEVERSRKEMSDLALVGQNGPKMEEMIQSKNES